MPEGRIPHLHLPLSLPLSLLACAGLICAGVIWAGEGAAQDDGFEKDDPAFVPFRDLVATGDLLTDALPSADASSSGCMVNYTLRVLSPDLGVPLTVTATADAKALDFEGWQPELREGEIRALIPATGTAFLTMTLSDTDRARQEAFATRVPARCHDAGCDATMAVPGFVFSVFDAPLSVAQAARDALRGFAQACKASQ